MSTKMVHKGNAYPYVQNKGKIVQCGTQSKL